MEQKAPRRNGENTQPPMPHSFHMDDRKKAVLTGVREVLAFDENQIVLQTDTGEICMNGSGLHVTKLMLEDGQLLVEGHVDGIWYSERRSRRTFWKRKP